MSENFTVEIISPDKSILKSLIGEIKVASKEYDGTAIGMAIANGIRRYLFIVINTFYVQRKQSNIVTSKYATHT